MLHTQTTMDKPVTQELVDAAKKLYEDLATQLIRQQNEERRSNSRARLPETCNHGKLVKVDDIGPYSSGYYYHVVEDGKGGWKNANDGTNYCDNWPNKP